MLCQKQSFFVLSGERRCLATQFHETAVTGQRPRRFNLILVDLQSLLFQVRMIGCCAKGPNWLDLVYIPDNKGLPRQGKRQSAHFRRDLSCLIHNEQINGAEQGRVL